MEYNKSSFSTRISTELILSIGSDDFVLKLSEALSVFLQFDHLTLFVFDSHLIPHLIAGSSGGEQATTSRIRRLYKKSHYYSDDPNTQLIGRNNINTTDPLIQQLHGKDIKNDAYRKFIYEDNNLLDRVSIIDHENQRWFIVNFYRDVGRDYFRNQTLDF